MAAQVIWQPKEGLREICGVLEQHILPTSDKSHIWQQLQHSSQFPDFNNYLAFIFANAEVHQEVSPIVMTVIPGLIPMLQHAEDVNRSLVENSAITLGRLALACPQIVSPHGEHFMQRWCTALFACDKFP